MADSVKIALRSLSDEERRRVFALFDSLKNWDNDPQIQKVSHPIVYKDTYVLTTSDGLRIFFNKDDKRILIVDIAKKKTIDQFAEAE